jgi:hypothetical protein
MDSYKYADKNVQQGAGTHHSKILVIWLANHIFH